MTELRIGQIIRLDQTVEDPLSIFVGGKYFGCGEVVSLQGGRWGIKVTGVAHRPLI